MNRREVTRQFGRGSFVGRSLGFLTHTLKPTMSMSPTSFGAFSPIRSFSADGDVIFGMLLPTSV